MLALFQKPPSTINVSTNYASSNTLNHIHEKNTHLPQKFNHASKLPSLRISCSHTILNNMKFRDEKKDDQSRSRVIARCEMEPKGRDPTPGHDDQSHSCGDKKYPKKDHLGAHDEHPNKACSKRGDAHSEPKSNANEWHDIFNGELREWKGKRSSKHDECDEDSFDDYSNRNVGCEEENQTSSCLNATYKGQKASLFPMTSYGPNFYAPVGTAVFHYHFDSPS